mmetsp:Transcript_13184/g.20862  ORF Transcript_13184/g.20862 Transcript_13184/m.20862 type:complete len:223 (-) Transcript_13184:457-1125(-)
MQHQVIETWRQLLPHDRSKIAGHRWRCRPRLASAKGPNRMVLQVEHWGVLDKNLADAVAIHMVVFHLLCREGLHPVDQRSLLHDVHRGVEVEAALVCRWLKVVQIQVRVGQAVLSAGEHARIDELVPGQLPLGEHAIKINPIEALVRKVKVDHHRLHAVQKQTRRPKNGLDDSLLRKVGQLCTGEVWSLQALVAPVPEVVEDEVDKVAIDTTSGHRKALLCR